MFIYVNDDNSIESPTIKDIINEIHTNFLFITLAI